MLNRDRYYRYLRAISDLRLRTGVANFDSYCSDAHLGVVEHDSAKTYQIWS